MTFRKRLISAVLSLSIALTSIPLVNIAASAISPKVDKEDYVDYDLFLINDEDDINEDVIKRIEKAARKDYDDLTYGDLQKITSLDLSGLEIDGIPPVVQYMFGLRTLDLSENLLCIDNVQNLDLSYCDELVSLDISNNYLVKAPSWFVSLDINVKDISNNLLGTDDQRRVELTKTAYYYILGDKVNENELKDRILSTLKLSDGTDLPEFFYDPDLPTYDIDIEEGDEDDDDDEEERNTNVKVELDLSKYVDKNGVVTKTGVLTGSAGLNVPTENENTSGQFRIYFLDGNSPSTLREQLEVLIDECGELDKGEYTISSWTSYEASLKTAQAIFDYPSADTDMLRTALDGLRMAVDSLVLGVTSDTKKTLSSLLSVAKTYKALEYSTASWEKFASAVAAIQNAVDDADTTIYAANTAIKDFQRAQLALTVSYRKQPDMIPKRVFEAIYGDDETIVAKGTTRGGNQYTISFNGNDVTLPADFNPEIVCESANEASMRMEAGSASDYKIISFINTNTFPGTALVRMDVSDVYTKGVYNLYKWNSSAKKSEFVKEVVVNDGWAIFTADSGGDYYLSSVLQNFQLISSSLKIDHEKLTIMSEFRTELTVGEFRDRVQNGNVLEIYTADGKKPFDSAKLATGMTASVPNSGVKYTVVVPGDCNCDGRITPSDTSEILRALVEYEALTTYEAKLAADVNGDGWVRGNDAVQILRYCVGL